MPLFEVLEFRHVFSVFSDMYFLMSLFVFVFFRVHRVPEIHLLINFSHISRIGFKFYVSSNIYVAIMLNLHATAV